MREILDRQTVVISVNLFTMTGAIPSQVSLPMNLRFAADELVVKNITYHGAIPPNQATQDISDVIQIWCNITNDNIIGSFPNVGNNTFGVCCYHDDHFRISNTFQTGNFVLQFQQTGNGGPASYNPQPLISALAAQTTFGVVVVTIEFIKHSK